MLMRRTLILQANTFQTVIAADQQMTFVFFIYGDIQWGRGANIGFNAGDGIRFFMVPAALTGQVLNIDEGSNVGVRGVYIYRVDLCSVLGPRDGEKGSLISSFPSSFRLLTVCKNGEGRPGERSPFEKTHFVHTLFVSNLEWFVYRFANIRNSSTWGRNYKIRPQAHSFDGRLFPPCLPVEVDTDVINVIK